MQDMTLKIEGMTCAACVAKVEDTLGELPFVSHPSVNLAGESAAFGIEDPTRISEMAKALSRANRRFHRQIHLASHNRYLLQQLDLVHRTMALLATTSLAAEGRPELTIAEHDAIVRAIETRDGDAADDALRTHISKAFETRLKLDSQRE